MKVAKSPDDAAARTNCVFLSPVDFGPKTKYVVLSDRYPLTAKMDQRITPGEIGTTLFQRKFASVSVNQDITVRPFDPSSEGCLFLSTMTLSATFLSKSRSSNDYLDADEMAKVFLSLFDEQVFTVGMSLFFEFCGMDILVTVISVEPLDVNGFAGEAKVAKLLTKSSGILIKQTSVLFTKAADSTIKLSGTKSSSAGSTIIKPDFNFANLGIGGLDEEFSNIFRRAFVSRIFPPAIVERMGIQHVKGILLYGPPGTGKTLMARQIGKMLNCNEPLIVNGPEILNKFVGASEENVRKLFAPAEAEYKAKGEESSLHIIIFDELDAICKQRGSSNNGTGVGDSIVNQLLSKMDGVNQLNNILIIGMTNRLDMIDEALLRPGRLEIHMEIGLPDEKGRVQILNVHSTKMRQYNLLEVDVDFAELAALTKNFSGAELAGLLKSASSFAFNRHVKIDGNAAVSPDFEKVKVCRADFLHALEECKAAFGVAETELQQCYPNGIIQFHNNIARILSDGALFVDQVRNSSRTPLVSVLLHGPPGSGKTALAASIALSSEFPYIKLISPESMVGYSETAKMNQINKIFNDAYKSPFSVIVIDAIERLLDYVAIGPRFSNTVLQTLLVLLKKLPPKNHKLLILATSSQKSVLDQMELVDAFNTSVYVPNITSLHSIEILLSSLGTFAPRDVEGVSTGLTTAGIDGKISVPVKKLIYMTEMAIQDSDKVNKLVQSITEEGLRFD